ncbi:HD-GYP domain-containing protein [Halalkalibacter urbisdiaboli]|uniref:HD-GYP domain-containing protein n=1 Tax=Halalkalibacter urbisdiaboli TaxID=1960589 RepID=UPI001FDA73BC|nr:HD-GYP domain-containing protein [Halalkalibacter urbisdiaboli]
MKRLTQKFYQWFYSTMFYRYLFFVVFFLSAIINGFLVESFFLYPLYIISVILLGIGFVDKSYRFLFLSGTLVVMSRIFLTPEPLPTIETALLHWFTYVIIMFISVGLMRNVILSRKHKDELISALINSLDSRDPYTAFHSKNVAHYAKRIGKEMKMSEYQCEALFVGGLLHDIGKIGVPERILTKPGRLSDEEYQFIQKHPRIGYETLKHITTFKKNGVLDMVKYHHERLDGRGYPNGLFGDEIPFVAKVIAIADSFDAMTSKRVYRKDIGLDYAVDELQKNKGTQFDPYITDSLLSILEREGEEFIRLL